MAVMETCCQCTPNPITAIVGQWLLSAKLGCSLHMPESLPKTRSKKHVISNVSAVFYPGDEATLLIAPSSSGKSTLMKTIANLCQEQTQHKTKGTLLGDDLTLTPVLTLEESLLFSANCAIDDGSTNNETVVGWKCRDSWSVAGGQKRRVKVMTDMEETEFLLRVAFRPHDFRNDTDESINASEILLRLLWREVLPIHLPEMHCLEQDLEIAESTKAKEPPKVIRPFARSFGKQLSLLLGRGWKLVVRNPCSFIRVLFAAILFGLCVGTIFLNTPSADAAGTRTRAGYAYTAIILLFMIASLSPTDSNFQDRGTLYCHCEANFYSSKAYYISTMLCSWPALFLEATFIVICSFFLTGMDSNGGSGFLYFWCMAIVISFCGTSISRVLSSYALPSNDIALALGPAVFLVFFNMTALDSLLNTQICQIGCVGCRCVRPVHMHSRAFS